MASQPVQLRRSADDLARDHTEKAIEVVKDIMSDRLEGAKDRLVAARILLDRGHGTPGPAVIALPLNKAVAKQLATQSREDLRAIVRAATPVEEYQRVADMDPIEAEFEPIRPEDDPLVAC